MASVLVERLDRRWGAVAYDDDEDEFEETFFDDDEAESDEDVDFIDDDSEDFEDEDFKDDDEEEL